MTENVSAEGLTRLTHGGDAAPDLDETAESVGLDRGIANHRQTGHSHVDRQGHDTATETPPREGGKSSALRHLGLLPQPCMQLPAMHVFHAPDLTGLLDVIEAGRSAVPEQPIDPTHPRVAFACEPAALAAKRRIARKLVEQSQATPGAPVGLSRARARVRESIDAAFPVIRALAPVRAPDNADSRSTGGVFFRRQAMQGEVAAVHAGASAVYQGAGVSLLQAAPSLANTIAADEEVRAHLAWLFGSDSRPSDLDLVVSSAFVSFVHASATRRIGLRPQAALGLSMGELSALVAHGDGVQSLNTMFSQDARNFFEMQLGGEAARKYFSQIGAAGTRWDSYIVLAQAEDLLPFLAKEPAVSIIVRDAPTQIVIGGEAVACRRVVKHFGPLRAFPLPFKIAVHCPAMREYEEKWRNYCAAVARDQVTAGRSLNSVRYYSNAFNASYHVTPESFADAFTAQMGMMIDFPATILRAWEDGVRIFVEHGSRDAGTHAVAETLGDRPHVAVSLDQSGRSGVAKFADAVAELIVAGVPLDLAALRRRADVCRCAVSW